MPQINKGDTFANGEQVTGARLNQLIDSATILPAIITEQTNLTANTVAANDSVLIYDLSATALREATPSDLLNSNIAVTTSSVTAGANSDITITPNDATIVSGATYTSGNGLTVVVTSNAHGLTVGQVVLISNASTGYNGTFRLTAVTTNTFTYVQGSAATPATSVGCSYTKKGMVKNVANNAITGNFYVDGDAIANGNCAFQNQVFMNGTVTHNGAVTMNSTLSVIGNVLGALNIPTAPTSGNHATNKTYVDGTISKTSNGYLTLSNGLILQWGSYTALANDNRTITLPIPFTTTGLFVVHSQNTGGNGCIPRASFINNSQIYLFADVVYAGNPNVIHFWFAIAY